MLCRHENLCDSTGPLPVPLPNSPPILKGRRARETSNARLFGANCPRCSGAAHHLPIWPAAATPPADHGAGGAAPVTKGGVAGSGELHESSHAAEAAAACSRASVA